MFNATYFHYDGQWSGTYGLQIADFDDSVVRETDAFSPTLSLLKVPGALRFFHGGIEYDSAPTCEFSVLSETAFSGAMRSVIMSWLIGKQEFRPMSFDDGDSDNFTYYCVFTSVKTIWINGRCHGFRLTAQFDSPFARGTPTIKTVGAGDHTITIRNMSDIADDYTYPIVEFEGTSPVQEFIKDGETDYIRHGYSSEECTFVDCVDVREGRLIAIRTGTAVSNPISQNILGDTFDLIEGCYERVSEIKDIGYVDIVNQTDDEHRHFSFDGLAPYETITIDNEVRYITSSVGGEKLSNFISKKWLRLRQGINTLTINSSGNVTIICPYYAMIGY